MHLALTLIPCFFLSLVLFGFLVVIQTTFAVTYPSSNLVISEPSFWIISSPSEVHSGVLEDLSWDSCCSLCLLMIYVMQLSANSIKSTLPLNLLVIATYYYSLTLTPYKARAMLTI